MQNNQPSIHKQLLDLASQLGAALKERGHLLALAESCTGGMASQYITAIAGSSGWFDRSFITYSNAAKMDMLGINPIVLEKFGAVSEETTREMAKGALHNSAATIAASISGIAGPDGGTASNPVGTVCFGIARSPSYRSDSHLHAPWTTTQHLTGNREAIRLQSVKFIFEQLLISATT